MDTIPKLLQYLNYVHTYKHITCTMDTVMHQTHCTVQYEVWSALRHKQACMPCRTWHRAYTDTSSSTSKDHVAYVGERRPARAAESRILMGCITWVNSGKPDCSSRYVRMLQCQWYSAILQVPRSISKMAGCRKCLPIDFKGAMQCISLNARGSTRFTSSSLMKDIVLGKQYTCVFQRENWLCAWKWAVSYT